MAQSRQGSPVLRATSALARSLYRELRRADYSPQDVIRLVNEMVELVTVDARNPRAVVMGPTHDRETGMPTGYSEELIDPRLKESGPVIVTDGELRTWLDNPSSI